jgi:hypothetical protein
VLRRVASVIVGVPDLDEGINVFSKLGFQLDSCDGGAFAFLGDDLLALSRDERPGLRTIVVESDDLEADLTAMRDRGVDVSEVWTEERHTRSGQTLRWRGATLDARDLHQVVFAQWLVPKPPATRQPNGAISLDRAYIAVDDLASASNRYARILGQPVPPVERGLIIKAEMAVFTLGTTGLALAQPAAPGPTFDAFTRQGTAPFQILYRTTSVDRACRWIVSNGVPTPTPGIRNTGERAILVTPEHACGTYVAFVGPRDTFLPHAAPPPPDR